MPRECFICEKKTMSGNRVSHSNIHTKRTFKANLQRVKINDNGSIKTVRICTRCLRSGKVERA
ncbi:MAG: 50S ribosomal protein L28 [Eubacteriaceae bacterium]|nr:50S ribosomal protein L28 [Eubacteriaceae bacterium]